MSNLNQKIIEDFDTLVQRKKSELENKHNEKVSAFSSHEMSFQPGTFDGDSTEGDNHGYTNPLGFRLGSNKGNYSLDAFETAKYDVDGGILPYLGKNAPTDGSKRSRKWDLHRTSYAKRFGLPSKDYVSQEMLNAEAEVQAQAFKDAASQGNTTEVNLTGDVPLNVKKNGVGFFDRDLITAQNPVTGEILNEVLNTSENNAAYFSDYNKDAWMPNVDFLRYAQAGAAKAKGKGFWDSFSKGVSSGIDNLQATGYGFAALIADATGNEELASGMLQEYLSQLDEARANGANLPNVEDVDWSNPTAALSKLGSLIGEAMPSIAMMMGTGGLGGLVAQGSKAGIKYGVKNRVKNWTSDKAKAKVLSKVANRGRMAGAYVGANVMETGSIYGNVASEGHRDSTAILGSLAGGSVAAGLEMITPLTLMNKFGLGEVATKEVRKTLIKNGLKEVLAQVGKETAKGGLTEGTTEALQFMIEESTQDLIKHGHLPDMQSAEFKSGLLNSFVAGFVPGGTLRGGASIVSEVGKQVDGDRKVTNEETARVQQEALDARDDTLDVSDKTSAESETNLQKALESVDTTDLGDTDLQGKNNLETAKNTLDALNNAESTPTIEKAKETLKSAIEGFSTNETQVEVTTDALLDQIQLEQEVKVINDKFDALEAKFPDRKEKYDAERERLINIKQRETANRIKPAIVKTNKAKRAETKVIRTAVENSIRKINAISRKLKQTDLSKKQINRLERERNNLGKHITDLQAGTKLSPTTQGKAERAIKSFDYQYEKANLKQTVEDHTKGERDPVETIETSQVAVMDLLDNPDANAVDLKEAALIFYQDYKTLDSVKRQLEKSLEKSKDKKQRKEIQSNLKILNKKLNQAESVAKEIRVKAESFKPTVQEGTGEVLYSLEIQSKETLDKLNPKLLNTEQKALLRAHRRAQEAEASRNGLAKKQGKGASEVNEDILEGAGKFKGFTHYLKQAVKGQHDKGKFDNFLGGLITKLDAFETAIGAIGSGEKVWIRKQTNKEGKHPITSVMPTVTVGNKEVENLDDYWWVTSKSTNLIEFIKSEIEFGKAVEALIAKNTEVAPGKAQELVNQTKEDELTDELTTLISKSEETGSLDDVPTQETEKPKQTTKTETTSSEADNDAVQQTEKETKQEAKEKVKKEPKTLLGKAQRDLEDKLEVLKDKIKQTKNTTAKLQFKAKAKIIRRDLAILKRDKDNRIANNIISKFRNSYLKLSQTLLRTPDILKIHDVNRVSLFSENESTELSTKTITQLLKKLGVKDKALTNVLIEYFPQFKESFNRIKASDKRIKRKDGARITDKAIHLLYVEDIKGNVTLPDDVIFAMMVSTLDWMALNSSKTFRHDDYVLAEWLYDDGKHPLTNKERDVFSDMGAFVHSASAEIGRDVINSLNLNVSTETVADAALSNFISHIDGNYADNSSLLKDPIIKKQLQSSVGLMAIKIAANVGKPKDANQGKLLQIMHGTYPKDLVQNEEKESAKKINTIKINNLDKKNEDNELNKLLNVIAENRANLEKISGTQTTLTDILDKPSEEVQEFTRGSFFPLNDKVKEAITKLQNVEWQGKEGELKLFALLEDTEVMEVLIGLHNLDIKHSERRDSYEAANDEKIRDVQQVFDYIKKGSKPFFFKWAAQKQHRLRIDSSTINGGRSKIHRALFMPTSAESTITSKQDRAVFGLAVGQALGVDIDKQNLKKSLAESKALMDLADSVGITAFIREGKTDKKEFANLLNEFLNSTTKEGKSPKASMHVLEALTAIAQYDAKKPFKTRIGLETDGITNGYAISLMQFLGGTPNELKNAFARIGVHIDGTHEQFLNDGKADIYETLTGKIADFLYKRGALGRINKGIKKSAKVSKEQIAALELIQDRLEIDGVITKFGRDLAKNPLMITNYGASVAKVIKALSEGIVDEVYDTLAEFQQEYNNANKTEKKAIARKVAEYQKNLVTFGKISTKENFVTKLKNNELKEWVLPPKWQLKLTTTMNTMYSNAMTSALEELVGPLEKARNAVVKAADYQFFAFQYQLNKAIAKWEDSHKGTMPLEEKTRLAESLALKFMPLLYGPWSTKTPIQIIKESKKASDKTAEIEFRKSNNHKTVFVNKTVKGFEPYFREAQKEMSVKPYNYEYIAPGVSAATNMVQNMDSVLLGELLLENPEVLPIFDAVYSPVKDVISNKNLYNESFRDNSTNHDFLGNSLKRLTEVLGNLSDKEIYAINQAYQENSHEGKALKIQIKKEKNDKKKNKLNAKKRELGNQSVLDNLNDEINRVAKERAALEKEFGKDWLKNATISQMFAPESLEQLDNTKSEVVKEDDVSTLESLEADVEAEVKFVYKVTSLKTTAQKVFDKLGSSWSSFYPDEKERQRQESHLQRVLDQIILKTGATLDNTTVILNKTDVQAHGNANIGTDSVNVNINKHAPKNYGEQTAQEVYLHELIHILTNSPLAKNASFRDDVRRIRQAVKKELNTLDKPYEIFLHKNAKGEVIYLTDKDSEIAAAQAQYEYLFGNDKNKNVLDEFLAYALTNKHLVRQLSNMPAKVVPLWNKESDANVIEKIVDLLTEVVNRIADTLSNKSRPKNLEMEIFALTKELVTVSQEKRGTITAAIRDQKLTEKYDSTNELVSNFLKSMGAKGLKVTSDAYIKGVDKLTKEGKINNFIANILYDSKLAVLMTSSYGEFIRNNPKLQQRLNRTFKNFKPSLRHNIASLKADMFGNIPNEFIKLMYKSQAQVDVARKQYKQLTEKNLLGAFRDLESLSDNEKDAITRVLLKTDFSVLEDKGAYDMDTALSLLTDNKLLKDEINKYAKKLGIIDNKGVVINEHYELQTNNLASFMMTGKVYNRQQYKNAQMIFETNTGKSKYNADMGSEIDDLDVYITLLAMKRATAESKRLINAVVAREFAISKKDKTHHDHNGITHVIHQHIAFKQDSLKEGFDSNPTLMTKGYIATITDPDVEVIFEDLSKRTELEAKGYQFVDVFEDIENMNDSAYGMFVIKNNPEIMRVKGILSVTAMRKAGTSVKEIIARQTDGPKAINAKFKRFHKTQSRLKDSESKNHAMLPVLDGDGNIVDYTIHMRHSLVEKLMNQTLNFSEVLSTMYSRQLDKVSSDKINKETIEKLYTHSRINAKNEPHKFINILDPMYEEEYLRVLPTRTKNQIFELAKLKRKKGKQKLEFLVEQKLLDAVFGYKLPSISNTIFFKNSPKAQRHAKQFEKFIFEMVNLAKVNIILKIPIVPMVNFTSNFITSMMYGIPPTYLVKKWREGIKELARYQKDAEKLQTFDLNMKGKPSLRNDKTLLKKREILVKNINENKVAPFIDMGLFNSITEDINQNDFTYRHKAATKFKATAVGEKMTGLFKGKVSEAANQAYMGEHTASFKTMTHFTQMSDFIARFAMYSHDTEVKGISKDKAYKQMVETFVNYDQPLNKYLQYANDAGLLFFVKYWIRIQRATINLVKEKPLNVGLLWIGNSMLDLDIETIMESSVLTGNFFPTEGGVGKVLGEVLIPPGVEILSGEGF